MIRYVLARSGGTLICGSGGGGMTVCVITGVMGVDTVEAALDAGIGTLRLPKLVVIFSIDGEVRPRCVDVDLLVFVTVRPMGM